MKKPVSVQQFLPALTALVLVVSSQCCAADEAGVAFFEKKIRPVLVQHCFECHSAKTADDGGGVRLDRKLTERKRLLTPGAADKSLLILALRYRNSDLQMPPSGRLPLEIIRDFERWVQMGAADPRPALDATEVTTETTTASIEAGREFWSFQPVRESPLPQLDVRWGQSPMDAFVHQKLVNAKLHPAPRADRQTLMRRASLVLIGLPPLPEEVEAFGRDERPDAFARLVDRLLASPAYGERWGRHWLDVMRYGDCNGADESRPFPNAWHFRNYVIDTFNRDVPYDRMLTEHLAGDLLEYDGEGNYEPVVGTGFLAIGTKILTQLDAKKRIADLVDEQIDSFSRAMLGLTVACARCHAHKFDPIPTEDYYALAGIFRSTTTLVSYGEWFERPAHTRESWQALQSLGGQLPALKESLNQVEQQLEQELANATAMEQEAEKFARGNPTIDTSQYGKGIGIIGDNKALDQFAEYDFEIPAAGRYLLQFRYAAKVSRTMKLSVNGKVTNEQALGEVTGDWYPPAQRWHSEGVHEVERGTAVVRIESKAVMPHVDRVRLLQIRPETDLAQLFLRQDRLDQQVRQIEKQIKPAITVMAVQEGKIEDAAVLIRGNANKPGKQIARGFLSVVESPSQTNVPADTSGRLQLAKWMTHPDHPLTSRVMVNRLWRWHFGKGIVSTTENFGLKGALPTHPELLDYLAHRLVENDWSIKSMHRAILLSDTWQMAAAGLDARRRAESIDPDNQRYWQFPARRLEAEAIRDSLLAVSQRLDPQIGGAPTKLQTINLSPEVLEQQQRYYDTSNRRTVYLPILRTNVYDFLTLLDFANPDLPTGNRVTTTVPTQAMLMMNSPLVKDVAERVAGRVLKADRSDARRVHQLYLTLLSRAPKPSEVAIALDFLRSYQAELETPDAQAAWTALCHAMLAGNEFVYLR